MIARAAELAAEPGHDATDQFNNPYIVPGPRAAPRPGDLGPGGRTGDGLLPGDRDRELCGRHRRHALKPEGVWSRRSSRPLGCDLGRRERDVRDAGLVGMVPPHWDPDGSTGFSTIEDEEAIAMTRRLAARGGIFAGVSTGANVVGSLRLAERLGPDAVIVTLAVDSGFKYMSGAPFGG